MEMARIGNTLDNYAKNNDVGGKAHLELFYLILQGKENVRKVHSLIFKGSPIFKVTIGQSRQTILHIVCNYRAVQIGVLQSLINLGTNVNAQTIYGSTPLHKIVRSMSVSKFSDKVNKAIPLLLKRGANPNIKDIKGLTPIQLALYLGTLPAVEAFLKEADQLPNINQVDDSTRLQHVVKCLLKERNDWSVSDTDYSIILHFLVLKKDEEMFEYVVKNTKFDANAMNPNGSTILHVVAEYGTPRKIKTLIDAGADPNVYSHYRRTPIFFAVKNNQIDSIQTFLDCGASLSQIQMYKDKDVSLLHYAIQFGTFDTVKLLVGNGADVNEIINHRSPLESACVANRFIVVQFLLNNGANVNGKNDLGKTALDECCESAKFEIVKFLLSLGAKMNQGDVSTLHYATKGGNAFIVRHLLELGADVNLRCQLDETHHSLMGSRTAFDIAIIYADGSSNRKNIIDTMLEYSADVNIANPVTGETPLHLACNSNKRQTVPWIEENIKLLLRSKANVNALDYRGLTPLSHVFDDYKRTNKVKNHLVVLVAAIVKKIVRKEWVVEANLKLLQEVTILPIYVKCLDEMQRMKKNIFSSLNLSYLNILTIKSDALGFLLTNRRVLQFLDGRQYKKIFPIYADDLEYCIWTAKLRYPVVRLAAKFFRKHVKSHFDDEFAEICNYLESHDLNNFLKACSVQLCEKRFFFSNSSDKIFSASMEIFKTRFARKLEQI